MHLLDFGSGTGLLLERIAPSVKKISAVDISSSMNNQLRRKVESLGCEVDIIQRDLEQNDISIEVDGIVSSMTMHHIKNIGEIFKKFYTMVKKGGFIAISDLDKEDGSFHTEDTGVYHHGFDRDFMVGSAKRAGFTAVKIVDASVVKKPHGEYSVFLLIASK